jgi:hypothetical protein
MDILLLPWLYAHLNSFLSTEGPFLYLHCIPFRAYQGYHAMKGCQTQHCGSALKTKHQNISRAKYSLGLDSIKVIIAGRNKWLT